MAVLGAISIITATSMVIDNDGSLVNMYSYFTIQSNLLVLVSAVLLVIKPDRTGTVFEAVWMAGLVGITVTGVVFATVLEGAIELEGQELWNDRIFHYIVPAMAVIGYLVLRPRTRFHASAYCSCCGRSAGWPTRSYALRWRIRTSEARTARPWMCRTTSWTSMRRVGFPWRWHASSCSSWRSVSRGATRR